MTQLMYPATLTAFLHEHSGMGDIAIGNAIKNYGYDAGNCPWDGHSLTRATTVSRPVPGGFHVRPSKLNVDLPTGGPIV